MKHCVLLPQVYVRGFHRLQLVPAGYISRFSLFPSHFPSLLEMMHGQDQTPPPIQSHAVPCGKEKCYGGRGGGSGGRNLKNTSIPEVAPSEA